MQRLEPLPTIAAGSEPPAAVELFVDRAVAHGVSLTENAEELGTIQELCARLDGIPLAVILIRTRDSRAHLEMANSEAALAPPAPA